MELPLASAVHAEQLQMYGRLRYIKLHCDIFEQIRTRFIVFLAYTCDSESILTLSCFWTLTASITSLACGVKK